MRKTRSRPLKGRPGCPEARGQRGCRDRSPLTSRAGWHAVRINRTRPIQAVRGESWPSRSRRATRAAVWTTVRSLRRPGSLSSCGITTALMWSRPARRHFTTQIGIAPKRYLRMLRCHQAVALKRAAPGLSWTNFCQAAGYYGQSHFIAEFRELGGAAPSRFMAELAAMPAASSRAFYRPMSESYKRALNAAGRWEDGKTGRFIRGEHGQSTHLD